VRCRHVEFPWGELSANTDLPLRQIPTVVTNSTLGRLPTPLSHRRKCRRNSTQPPSSTDTNAVDHETGVSRRQMPCGWASVLWFHHRHNGCNTGCNHRRIAKATVVDPPQVCIMA